VGPDLVKAGLIDDVASMVENQLIFPTEEYLKSTHSFMALDESQMRDYKGDFDDVTGG
jgi:spermidine/putrescine transport system substrate-binding protein